MDDVAGEIVARAKGMGEEERRAFIDHACASDPELKRRIESALETADGLGGGGAGATVMAVAAPGGEGPGSMIGPYKILQEIGEGGFGAVYMAQQAAPIRRRVALKIVKAGMDTKQVIGRFEAERQALAMMDHPNIAKVYDAGTTQAGRPYFVMELVKGVPITEYCDTGNLTTRERLELFMHVCQAVLHAHQKGIIHRDIKPSNVMVTLHDGTPVVKVIDFGIAKATGQDLTDKTVFTEYRHFIGTPAYMSPEQAAMSGLDVDTRSDIYSLGVLLYELLTGTTPFDAEKLRAAGYAEIQRIIKEEEPPRPSTRVGKTTRGGRTHTGGAGPVGTATAEEIARHRKTDPRSLRRQLSGDIDWIVMKAMEKDRTRRYATAGALAEDLRRSLANEPITARSPTAAYRFRKFSRRNRGLIGAMGGTLAALLLTLAALGYGLVRVSYEKNKTAELQTEAKAKIILSTMNSVRHYTSDRVKPTIQKASGTPDVFVQEMVPGFSAREVFADFRKDPAYQGFRYKEATLNPTNRENKADDFETGVVQAFRDGKAGTEVSGYREMEGAKNYYIARPMPVGKASCLECHTSPETAPPKQVELYGREGGYGWKMGEIVGAQIVYVPATRAFQSDPRQTVAILGGLGGVFVLGGLIAVVLLRRA